MSANPLNIPSEAIEQQKLIQWLRLKKIFHYATTNENNSYKQDRKYAMIAEQKAKSQGKLKGVADITVLLPNKILFIELKKQGKKLKNGNISHVNSAAYNNAVFGVKMRLLKSYDESAGWFCLIRNSHNAEALAKEP